ncbi:FliG C-terminal domain-containing protein [Algoriphagus marincola]|uniref:FliG C-terminal domain-containing protein n=1 Tax=Algoriphagus marincola TaxID=264027 RepID=UPI00047B1388|nr:FliG C-terminal domain-containing protein [Algoriphagus marincola]
MKKFGDQFARRISFKTIIFLLGVFHLVIFFPIDSKGQDQELPQSSLDHSSLEPSSMDWLGLPFIPNRSLPFFDEFLLEMELEAYLIKNLSPFVDSDRFFLSIKYEAGIDSIGQVPVEDVESEIDDEQPRENRFYQPLDVLPVLPDFWADSNSVNSSEEDFSLLENESERSREVALNNRGDNSLFLPEDMSPPILVGNLQVHFVLDDEVSESIEELLYKITFYSLKLYAFESHEITFERLPLYNLFPAEADSLILDSLERVNNQESLTKEETNSSSNSNDTDNLRLLEYFLMALAILSLILLLIYLSKRKNSRANKENKKIQIENSSKLPDSTEEEEDVPMPISSSVEVASEGVKDSNDQFLDYFVKNTPEIGKVFSHWIEDYGKEGIERVHTILMPMGKNMYTLLFPYLSKESTELLLKSFYTFQPEANQEKRKYYIEKMKEIISSRLGIDSMALLETLEKAELFELLDLLSSEEAAIALYHMPLEDRARYLKQVTPERVVTLLKNVSSLKNLNSWEYEKLGNEISEKLVELRFYKKYQKEDVQFMLDSIDRLEFDQQDEIMKSLEGDDPALYKIIKRKIFSWSDVKDLDQNLVREATLSFTPEEISIAYPLMPEEIENIISLRPEREQQLIKEMAFRQSTVLSKNSKEILSKILNAIKNKYRSNEK